MPGFQGAATPILINPVLITRVFAMRILTSLLGLVLLLLGIYFLGRNIVFTTQTSAYWWRDISAAGSVLSVTAGTIALLFFGRSSGMIGWVLIGLGILLAFVSGGLIVRPTSLWTFFVAMTAFVAGFQLIRTGRISL